MTSGPRSGRSPRGSARRPRSSRGSPSWFLLAGLLAASIAGCAAAESAPPQPTAVPAQPTDGALPSSVKSVIVTFRVGGTETFRVRLTDRADITQAYGLLAGRGGPAIPNGRLVRGSSDGNVGHDWSLDPADFEFADLTTEVCDGLPSVVDDPSFTSERYCPWSAEIVAVEPAASWRGVGIVGP